MAYSVNWLTKVVTIHKSDMILTSVTPEVYELNLETMWLTLVDIQDSEDGMLFPDIVKNTAPFSVGPTTFARIVEIINGYTITFEDGPYAVDITGANTNIADVINRNQVSYATANSGGLVVGGGGGGGGTVDFNLLMDGQEVEAGFTLRESLRLILAAVAGPVTNGAGPVTEIKDVNNTKTRISSTVDEDGNRGPLTYDTSD